MIMIFKLFFLMVALSVFLTFVSLLSVAIRVRKHLRNPFEEHRDDLSRNGQGDIIEGEYKVLDEKNKD